MMSANKKGWFCNHKIAVSYCIFRGVLRREELVQEIQIEGGSAKRSYVLGLGVSLCFTAP